MAVRQHLADFKVRFQHNESRYFRHLSESEESENSDYSPSEDTWRGSSKKKKKFKRVKKLPPSPKPKVFREIRTRKKEIKYVCLSFTGRQFLDGLLLVRTVLSKKVLEGSLLKIANKGVHEAT